MTSTSGEEIFKTDRRGRVRVPEERRRELLEEFGRSGMSGAGFARHYGLKYATFANWVQQARKRGGEVKTLAAVRFFEATPAAIPSAAANGALMVEFPGGGRITVCTPGQAQLAAALLVAIKEAAGC